MTIPTRWMDGEHPGHVAAVLCHCAAEVLTPSSARYLIPPPPPLWLDMRNAPVVGFAVDSGCTVTPLLPGKGVNVPRAGALRGCG